MPSIGNESKMNRSFDRLGIVRTALVQILVLLALAGAAVWYVNWSSDVALQEFISANPPPLYGANHDLQSSSPVRAVKGRAACARRA